MTIEDNKKYKLTGEQIKDIASRFGVLSGEIGDLSTLTTTDKTDLVSAVNEVAASASSYTAGDGINISAQDVISATNTGKAKVLTTDDYNWPTTGAKTSVALWLLPDGIYYVPRDISTSATSMYAGPDSGFVLVAHNHYQTSSKTRLDIFDVIGNQYTYTDNDDGSLSSGGSYVVLGNMVTDNLTSTSSTRPLSAKQGKVLNERIGNLTTLTTTDKTSAVAAINEIAANTPAVVQTTGTSTTDVMSQNATTSMVYADPATKTQIQLGNSTSNNLNTVSIGNNITAEGTRAIAIGDRTDDTIVTASGASAISIGVNNSSTGGNGIAIGVRAKAIGDGSIAWGTYATSSGQYALATHYQSEAAGRYSSAIGPYAKALSLSSMAFGTYSQANGARSLAVGERATTDSEGSNNMAIGYYASATGNGSMAVGLRSSSTAPNALALGAYSSATQQGEMNIGTTNTTYGYNNSNYRLLSGVYDPQSAHDAATKGYVDGLVGDIEAALHAINYGESS